MGLDISYYRNLRDPRPLRGDSDYDDENLVIVSADPAFLAQLGSLQPGMVYTGEYVDGFRAGSYSGYNVWREALAQAALGVSAADVWDQSGQYAGKPFVELINFSDCEGVIGPEVCAKLAQDFAAYRDRLLPLLDDRYDAWQRAFTVAGAEHGCVDFH